MIKYNSTKLKKRVNTRFQNSIVTFLVTVCLLFLMGRYKIVVCPNCESPWIVDGHPERTSCSICSKSHKLKKLRIRGEFDSTEAAREAIAYIRTVLSGNKKEFEELKEEGVFSDETVDELTGVDTKEYLKKNGVNAEEVMSTANDNLSQTDVRKEIINILEENENPTNKEDLLTNFKNEKQKKLAEKIIQKLRNSGVIIVNQKEIALA